MKAILANQFSQADRAKLDGITDSADSVSFSRTLSSGTKIGTITINGTSTDLYCQTDTNTTYSAATTSAAGLMSAADKTKLDGITASADSVSFSQSLTSGTTVGTITINGTTTTLYAPTNTDTHYTTGIVAGGSGATANAATTSPYIAVKDDSTYRSQVRLIGSGGTTVTSDASGNITITSTDNNTDTKVTQTNSTSNSSYRLLLSGSANDTTETATSIKSTKFQANPSTGRLTIGADPVNALDVATKQYVDSILGGDSNGEMTYYWTRQAYTVDQTVETGQTVTMSVSYPAVMTCGNSAAAGVMISVAVNQAYAYSYTMTSSGYNFSTSYTDTSHPLTTNNVYWTYVTNISGSSSSPTTSGITTMYYGGISAGSSTSNSITSYSYTNVTKYTFNGMVLSGTIEQLSSTDPNAYSTGYQNDGYYYTYKGSSLANKIAKITSGSYIGTGTYGSDNPNSLVFESLPSLIIVQENTSGRPAISWILPYAQTAYLLDYNGGPRSSYQYVSFEGNTVYWYTDTDDTSWGPLDQLNATNYEYTWVALG